jgi:hypothetical protein
MGKNTVLPGLFPASVLLLLPLAALLVVSLLKGFDLVAIAALLLSFSATAYLLFRLYRHHGQISDAEALLATLCGQRGLGQADATVGLAGRLQQLVDLIDRSSHQERREGRRLPT